MNLRAGVFALAMPVYLSACSEPRKAAEIQVAAAASLTDVLREIAGEYEDASGEAVAFNFASSSLLARQIAAGAPVAVFVSADESIMDQLEKQECLAAGSRRRVVSNSLVVIVEKNSPARIESPKDLAKLGTLALAEPASVPAGMYAREFLLTAGVWDAMEGRVVPFENVRAALAAVASGNVDAGIVYKTDAEISRKVRVALVVPVAEGPAISYPAAVIKDAEEPAAARRFVDFLGSPEAQRIFNRHGFLPPR